jgi:teichuronic acid biosynthesis glycosyltransferase TuaG
VLKEDGQKFIDELVTIVMPTYNSQSYIKDSIGSVIAQTYPHWILQIVDDASTDNTVEILRQFEEADSRIFVTVNTINSGAAVTRNIALSQATGRYVAFLDSDDLWHRRKLEKQIRFMRQGNLPFTFTPYSLIDQHGRSIAKLVDMNCKSPVNYRDMLAKRATMGCSSVIIDRKAISNIKMPLLRTGQDYALWLKILKQNRQATCFREELTNYRIVPGSISRNKFQKSMRQWQIYRSVEELNVIQSTWYFLNYAWRAIFRS